MFISVKFKCSLNTLSCIGVVAVFWTSQKTGSNDICIINMNWVWYSLWSLYRWAVFFLVQGVHLFRKVLLVRVLFPGNIKNRIINPRNLYRYFPSVPTATRLKLAGMFSFLFGLNKAVSIRRKFSVCYWKTLFHNILKRFEIMLIII